jgi:DNA topoisomerase-1
MPLVIEMPGKCPKCGGRLVKRTGVSKKNNKQYTYYCCEFLNSKVEEKRCDFMTWDVPVKDNCPVCGQTMFKLSGRGFKRAFCINEQCSNFTPEDKRGGYRKKTEDSAAEGQAAEAGQDAATQDGAAEEPAKKTAAKKTTTKTTAKKTTAKKSTAAKATTTRSTAAKKTAGAKTTAAKKSTTRKAATKKAEE